MTLEMFYAIVLAIGLVVMFAVVVVILINTILIKKSLNKIAEKPSGESAPVKNKQTGLAQKKRCTMCLNETREGAVFCDICGSRL